MNTPLRTLVIVALGLSWAMAYVQFRQIRERAEQMEQLRLETEALRKETAELQERFSVPGIPTPGAEVRLGKDYFGMSAPESHDVRGSIRKMLVPPWAYSKEKGKLEVGCRGAAPFWVFTSEEAK